MARLTMQERAVLYDIEARLTAQDPQFAARLQRLWSLSADPGGASATHWTRLRRAPRPGPAADPTSRPDDRRTRRTRLAGIAGIAVMGMLIVVLALLGALSVLTGRNHYGTRSEHPAAVAFPVVRSINIV